MFILKDVGEDPFSSSSHFAVQKISYWMKIDFASSIDNWGFLSLWLTALWKLTDHTNKESGPFPIVSSGGWLVK